MLKSSLSGDLRFVRALSPVFAAGAVMLAGALHAAVVEYVGSAESGDISLEGNWGGALPGTADTASFPAGFAAPADGLSLSRALTLGSFSWYDTSGRILDLGGKTLTFDDDSDTSQMSLGANAVLTIRNGTVNVDSAVHRLLPDGDYGTIVFTNMTMTVKKPDWRFSGSYGKGFTTRIMKDARVIFTEGPSDQRAPMSGQYDCSLIVDGGFLSMMSAAGNYTRLAFNQDWENGQVKVLNGGVIEFTGPSPAIRFNGHPTRILVDGGSMYQTNGITWYTDNYGIRYANYTNERPGTFAVTNSTIKGTRFNFMGKGGNLTMHDSEIDFYFGGHAYAGFMFGSANAVNNATVSGTTSFKAKSLTWNATSSGSNVFTVAGGTFDAPVSMQGTNGLFAVTGGEGNGTITMEGFSNRVEMAGGEWTHTAALTVGGVSNVFLMAGTASVTGTHTVVSGEGSRFVQDGVTAYGGIRLTGDNVTAHLKNGAMRKAFTKNNGLQFAVGVSNAVFVIENATYENKGNFSNYYKGSGNPHSDAGCTYTNCPGSAIEFRGSSPKFINSGANLYEGGGVYMAMVLGSFTPGESWQTGAVLGTEPLVDPVALRYVLPPDGYAEAPLQGTLDNRLIVFAGNARIEVDASAFVHDRSLKYERVPLASDVGGFESYGHLMLDIDALNRNNAAYLPEDSVLEYVAADKTLYLKFTNHHGLTFTVR